VGLFGTLAAGQNNTLMALGLALELILTGILEMSLMLVKILLTRQQQIILYDFMVQLVFKRHMTLP